MTTSDIIAAALVVAVFVLLLTWIIMKARMDKRQMDELWAAAREADRKWDAAWYAYITRPTKKDGDE